MKLKRDQEEVAASSSQDAISQKGSLLEQGMFNYSYSFSIAVSQHMRKQLRFNPRKVQSSQ